ncbi:CHRD domain-containing protein [Algoriphagus lacus]
MIQPDFNKNWLVKLSGANEVPMVMTDATGVAKFQVNPDGQGIDFQVNVDGISDVRFSHIHFGKPGTNGPVVFTLRGDKVSGPVSGVYAKGTITAPMLSGPLLGGDLIILREAMRTGNAYVNVHSDKFGSGELRGNF